ncbi:ATPase [Macleaya cordata]|uniref:ATPase n=1 Tax=Macleaya cordata TaxID=56857 RepID=A0A200QIJ7_MACCD|nr:ATPase [Macleaya cordata]
MPTPVSVAREFLTLEASRAVEEAVVVARRRGHSQTTSLHALSAFLSLPSSSLLREAISRVRSSIYTHRLQFKALELCFNVSLDRLPSSKTTAPDEPPISNSFMAAIKRSQATQKRHPENFHLNHHLNQQNQQSSVKVELQQLILSILDDPVVSRVFGEAGFKSYDIKLSIVRPPRVFNSRCPPPLFLCNLTGNDTELGKKSFNFPFSGFSCGLANSDGGDENCRRIGEVLMRKKERNPLLVGVCANDALQSFKEIVERGDVLPVEITGLSFNSIEKEVLEFINGSGSERLLRSRFEELEKLIEGCSGPGIVVSFGDLKAFIDENIVDSGQFVVTELMKLLELHREKLWLMGTAASYETYLKFIRRFPSVEKDWDLQLLPITSLRPSIGGFYSRPHSLMESFVPLGGFFSTPSDLKGPLSSKNQSISRCNLCNEKYEQEVSSILQGGCTLSVADQYKASLPSWLQTTELSQNKGFDVSKVKDDGAVLNAKVIGLQKKWTDICQRLNHISPMAEADISRVGPQVLPGIVGHPFVADRKDKVDNCCSSVHASPSKSSCKNVFPTSSIGFQKFPTPNQKMPIRLVCEGNDDNLQEKPSKSESFQTESLSSPACPLSSSGIPSCHASPATSVTTDLGLGTLYAPTTHTEPKNPIFQAHKERLQDFSGCSPSKVDVVSPNVSSPLQDFSGCFPSKVDLVSPNVTSPPVRPPSCSTPHSSGHFDPRDVKTLWRSLAEKVGRQNEVIYDISETIAHCRTGNVRRHGTSLRRDIWFSFLGPDRIAKRRIAEALAEIIFGSRKNLIFVDLSSEGGITCSSSIFGCQEIKGYDIKFRGKTIVDYIAEEISKKPLSIVFLENVDKADLLAQNSLTQAIRTGKFSDLHGRETSINNAIFITTSGDLKDKPISSGNELINFYEERILRAESWQMQILIGRVSEDTTICKNSNVLVTSRILANKRKLTGSGEAIERPEFLETTKRACRTSTKCLDLNLPAHEIEENYANSVNDEDSNSASDYSDSWLEEFIDQVDKRVVFKPFDFDALADKVLKEINKSFRNTFESNEVLLEIDLKVMEQILAAAWLSDENSAIEDWVKQVLGRSFADIRRQSFSGVVKSGSSTVLKLVACEGLLTEEKASGICLPSTIILN